MAGRRHVLGCGGSRGCGRRLGRWLRPLGPVVLVGVALAVAGFWLGRLWPPPLPLQVPAQALELGDVWENPALEWLLPIRNVTTREVRIEGFVVSCACARVEPEAVVVPAGGEVTVRLVLRLLLSPGGAATQQVSVRVTPQLVGYASPPLQWVLTGRVKRLLSMFPPEIYLTEKAVVGETVTCSLHTYSAVPLQALRATTDLPAGQVQVSGGPKGFHIAVTYTPQSAGEITGEVCLQPWDLCGQRLLERRARICGWAREEVEARPMRILLGAVPLGKDCQETIIIQSQRGMPFEVTGWEAPANCRIEPASTRSADPACRYYHLQLRIVRPG